MSGAVNLICDITRLVIDATAVASEIRTMVKNPDPDENGVLEYASVGLNALSLVANSSAFGARCAGATDNTLSKIKAGEVVVNIVRMPVKAVKSVDDYQKGKISGPELVEQGFVEPLLRTSRTAAEYNLYRHKHLLSLPKEEREKYQEPIYDAIDPEIIVGYKPITEAVCRERIVAAKNSLPSMTMLETVVKSGGVAKTANNIYQTIFNQIQRRIATAPISTAPTVVSLQTAS